MRTRAFDEIAGIYDETFTHTAVGRALREIVWSRFGPLFHASRQVLELGCGTGEDAVRLARTGVRVVATDASPQMIQVARRKALQEDCHERIEFRRLPMEEIGSLSRRELFDGVFSNFGAVNCVGNLEELIADVAVRTARGAPLLWVVMGRHAPWEWMWYLLRGQWQKAWRRLQPGGTDWRGLTISYPTPGELRLQLQPHFEVTRIAPLGFLLPPGYASHWLERLPRALTALSCLEKLAQHAGILASVSDHFIVEAVRR